MNKLQKECIGIVNQLFDITEVSVEKRQQINDIADKYLLEQITRLLSERDGIERRNMFIAFANFFMKETSFPL